MKIATLAVITRKDGKEILLGYKTTGEIGVNTFNGPGGKCLPDESPLDCVIRETKEEVTIDLDPKRLTKVAVITFFAGGVPNMEVHCFRGKVFWGTPKKTKDMIPEWCSTDALPFDRMLESDPHWFPQVIRGKKFRANVYYREKAKGFEKIEFFPF